MLRQPKEFHPRHHRDAAAAGLRVLGREALGDIQVGRMARLFREVFAAGDYGQYVFYPSEMRPLSPDRVFGAETERRGWSVAELDALDLATLRRPDGEQPLFWQHPEITFQRLRDKLAGRGHAVVSEGEGDDLAGMVFGYPATLRGAFAGEEWENPVVYSGWVPPRLRSFARFCECLGEVVARHPALGSVAGGVRADTPVFVLNCIAVSPRHRGGGLGRLLMRRFIETVPDELVAGRLLLGEIKIGSAWHRGLDAARVIEVPGALSEAPGEPRLIAAASPAAFAQPG